MADQRDQGVRQITTHRELMTYVIEHRSSCRQRASCDLNEVLTLRESARSAYERPIVVQANNRNKV